MVIQKGQSMSVEAVNKRSAIEIRSARPSETDLVLSLVRELAEYERLLPDCVATEEQVGETLFSQHPRAFCEIAECDGEPAGFAIWFYNYSTFRAKHGIYLEDLFVRPAYRGRGLGKALLVHLARWALQDGCARFEWSVLNWNEPSIAFYKALGAKPMTEWTAYRVDGEPLERLAGL
jgi:GNAT superfamily N-acetyltransferase